jgi:hypothetical protein
LADVTYTFTSEATLGGEKKTIEHSGTVSGVTQVYDQMIPLTTTTTTILSRSTTKAGATLADWTMLVLENLSSTDAEIINVAFSSTTHTENFVVQIPAGRFFIMWDRSFDADSTAAASDIATPASSVEKVLAEAASGTPNLRVVVYDDT